MLGSELKSERAQLRLALPPALGGVLIYILIAPLVGLTADLLGFSGDWASADRDQVGIQLVAQIPASLAVVLFALVWPLGVAWCGKPRLLRAVLLYLAFLLVWYPLAMLVNPLVLKWFDLTFEAQPHLLYFQGDLSGWQGSLAVIAVCIGGPVMEEIIFRGFFQSSAVRILGRAGGLFMTSLAFGLIHGPLYAFPMLVMGLFLGSLREKTAGLAAPILIHILHNAHTVLLACMFPSLLELAVR